MEDEIIRNKIDSFQAGADCIFDNKIHGELIMPVG